MCRLASFIVTREKVLWHPSDDGHEKIISYYNLDDKRESDFVRVEMVPPGMDYSKPLKEWEFVIDQPTKPEWFSKKTEEEMVRAELPKWRKKRQFFFDAMDFVATIKDVPWFKATKKPLKAWKVFDSRDAAGAAAWDAAWAAAEDAAGAAAWDAAGAAAGDAAGDAARDAAWDAAGAAAGDAARDAARDVAWAAAGDAAWDAARDAAWAAAGDATWTAAWAAARDAALISRCIIVADTLDEKHMAHARARWEVWERGYGLLCDVNGVLYVYRKP